MAVSLEQITDFAGTLDQDALQRNIDKLASLVPGFGGASVEIRFGAASATFTASAVSAATTVTHGLGRTPIRVVATGNTNSPGFAFYVHTYTATTFKVSAWTTGAFTGSATCDWVAIG